MAFEKLPLLARFGLATLWLLAGVQTRAADPLDEFTRAVASYELTLANLEAYGATMAGLATWAEAKPAEAAALRQRGPKGPTTFEQSVAHVGTEPIIVAQSQKNKLTARDFVLLPAVVMQAQIAALGEAQGRSFPADRINPKNTVLVRANEAHVNEIMTKVRTDRGRTFGR